MGLSVIIITQDEAHNIGPCLESVSFADEVVVLDGGSSDRTREIASEMGARVHIASDWQGFGVQKNRVLALATQEWVLSLDADERVSPELAASIAAFVGGNSSRDAYEMSRMTWYCGKFLRHSGTAPDYVLRLFRRGTARFSDNLVHERLLPDGPVGRLEGKLLHYSFMNFSDVLKKIDGYTTASAKQALDDGRTSSVGKAVGRSLWMFFRTYVLKRGFLDGAHGFAMAASAAQGTYYRYMKIWNGGQEGAKAPK
ncbi:glycosyltransferase family 2 protein [Mesorhizobium sp. ANAO-SY3R2]|uniref:glycosyltransferase family 2 protein n=1 Tax=Mesorhizobium sp. ANAO-SY3R2 TaxID=3166644 RepID=UPI003670D0F8